MMKRVEIGRRKFWEDSISRDEAVLDIGCWDGEKVEEFRSRGIDAYGMDINRDRLSEAKKELGLMYGDVTKKIPFGRKFDWVIFGEVLEHVDDDEAALRNISDSLRAGGKLILTTPRSVKFFQMWDPAWFRWKFLGGGRHYHYTQDELFSKLNKAGFDVKEFYIGGDFVWVVNRWLNVFLEYVLGMKKVTFSKSKKGFCDWVVLAERVK